MGMIELSEKIEEAVSECLEDRVGVAFSGGLDSATIAKVAAKSAEVDLIAVGMAGSDDLTYSRIVARELGLKLTERVLTRDEIVAAYHAAGEIVHGDFLKIEIMAPVYVVCETAKKMGLDVVLFGSAAEELFVGYERYYTYWNEGKNLDEILKEEFATLKNRDIGMIKRVARKVGIEARFPFYNKAIAEEVFGIPVSVRMEDRELKKGLLREAAHFLGVPEVAVKRKKKALQYGSGVHKVLLKEVGDLNLPQQLQ